MQFGTQLYQMRVLLLHNCIIYLLNYSQPDHDFIICT